MGRNRKTKDDYKKATDINLWEFVQEVIARCNESAKTLELGKTYEVKFVKETQDASGRPISVNKKEGGDKVSTISVRKLKVYVHVEETGERKVLHEQTFRPRTPADLLNVNWRKILLRDFVFQSFFFVFRNVEDILAAEAIKRQEEKAKELANKNLDNLSKQSKHIVAQ